MAIKTMSELIKNKGNFNIRNVAIFSATDDIIYVDYTLFTKYRQLLNGFITTVITEPADRETYTYKPGLLSNRLYGTTELDHLLLMINNCESPSDFRVKKTLNLILPDDVEYFFNTLVLQNKETLEKNKLDVGLL